MTFVRGPEGVTFPADKPAKLRFFLGCVDNVWPAGESGFDQVNSAGGSSNLGLMFLF